MAVKAITPRVTAISGHVQIYRDLDFHDLANDERVSRAFDDPYALPISHRASNERPAQPALSADPMLAPEAQTAGRYSRASGAPSTKERA